MKCDYPPCHRPVAGRATSGCKHEHVVSTQLCMVHMVLMTELFTARSADCALCADHVCPLTFTYAHLEDA